MTKKDYIVLARELRRLTATWPVETVAAVVDALVPVFKANNPRFDATRFRAAIFD